MTGKPPRFNPTTAGAKVANAVVKLQNQGRYRSSPRERGYDSKWDRLSIGFRKRNPFCRFCRQLGRDTLTAVTDHIIPAAEREDLKYEWKNLQGLCDHCHRVLKAQMELYARANGLLDKLPGWCSDLNTLPVILKPMSLRSVPEK